MVDYVLGEGPNSRYALLCKHCYAHNGLVAPEERENTRTLTHLFLELVLASHSK